MGKEGDLSTDVAKPKVPLAETTASTSADVSDSTSADPPDQTADTPESLLSQQIWFDEAKAKVGVAVPGEAAATAAKSATTPVDGLELTPIQTVLSEVEKIAQTARTAILEQVSSNSIAIPDSTIVVGDVPILAKAPGTEVPTVPDNSIGASDTILALDDTPPVIAEGGDVEDKPGDKPAQSGDPLIAPIADQPAPTAEPLAGDKQAANLPEKPQPLTDAEIEQLRKNVVEADQNAPLALTSLIAGRSDTLTIIGKFATIDMTGRPDLSTAAYDTLRTQEMKQSLEYAEYLAPGTSRTDLATALISQGDDVSIREGERLLVEAVQVRPDLIFHPNFRAQVMDSYNKMAEFRKDRNLEPWTAEIPIKSVQPLTTSTPDLASTTPWQDKTDEHFKAANEAYFNSGVKAALPEFQKAIGAADETAKHNQDRMAKERLELFVSGLTADRAIAQGQVTGESTTEMEKRRVDIWEKQVNNYVEDATGSRARMNVGLAMIASGDPEMLAQGNQYLQDAATKHPGLVYAPGLANFGNEFAERLLGAYKANAENSAPAATTGGDAEDGPKEYMPTASKEDLEGGSADLKAPLPGSNTDMKVEGYGWDKATDIGLPIATLALMLYSGRRQYNNYQRNKAAREANFALEPTERGDTQKDIITRRREGGDERFEIKGRAKDGQIVAKNLSETADTSASSKPPVDLPKDFGKKDSRTGRFNFGEYQPVAVDGKKYFLNKSGEAFEHKGNQLHPTDSVRGLTQAEVTSHNLNPLPADLQRNSFQNLGRELTPMGTMADGRVVLRNSTTSGAVMRDTIAVPETVDPFKGEFQDLKHQRLAGKDYFISPENKVYTFLQPERKMMEVHDLVVKPQDAVYSATGMPGSSAEERALNKQVNEILEPLRTRLRAGEQVDALTKAEYMDRARDALMPAAKEIAKSLGLPESVITKETFRFAEFDSLGSHNSLTGEVRLNIFGDSHLTGLDHEIKHKKQSLDLKAALVADRAGFREALLERSLNEIGKPGRRFTDNGIDSRPVISDPKAVEQLQKLVRDQVLRDYAERGLINRSDAPLSQPDSALSKELVTALGSADAVKKEVLREAQNVRKIELQNMDGPQFLNEGSKEYIDRKAEAIKRWQADNASTASGGALKNHPEVKQMLESIAVDSLATHAKLDPSLRPYYKFSPTEIDARQNQVDAALQRLSRQLKAEGDTTALADHPEGKKLSERGKVIELQKQLLSDFQSGDVQEARANAKELLKRMEAEPQLYVDDVRFMQERGLLTAEQTNGTKFEPLLRTPLTAAEGITSSDYRVAALETPGFTSPGGEDFRLDLARLETTREHIKGSASFKADQGQVNVYNLLTHPHPEQGILAQLKAEKRISADWDIFPTEPKNAAGINSPADQVGADFILVNKKTGDFFFLDATKNPDKNNVFELRAEGVILYKSEYFDREHGELEQPHKGEKPNERQQKAGEFKDALLERIEKLTNRPADFNLKNTPMPDVVVTTPEQAKAQVERLIKWAGEQPGEKFAEMKRVLSDGVKVYQTKKAVTAPSEEFERAVRQRTQKEVAKFVAAKASRSNTSEKIGGSTNTDTIVSAREDKIELVDGERIHSTKTTMSDMLKEEYRELQKDPLKIIKQLSKDEIIGLDKMFDAPPFKGKNTDKLKAEIERQYRENPRGPVGKVVEKLGAALIDNRGLIENGGKVGTGPKVIEQNVLRSLRTATTDNLLARNKPVVQEPKAAQIEPGEVFAKEVPNASKELRAGIESLLEGKLGTKANESVSEWMQEMVKDARDKKTSWSAEEIARFTEIADKYKAGDAETVKQVNDWLDKRTTDAAQTSELAGPVRNTFEVPSPVGAEQLGQFRDLVSSAKHWDGSQFFSEVARTAKSAVSSQINNRRNKLAFSQTDMTFTESASLKPGESELIIRKGTQEIKPIAFEGGNGVEPVYVTADGTKIPAKDVKVEIKIGAGSSKDQVAREGLVRAQQLAEIVQGNSKSGTPVVAQLDALRRAYDQASLPGDGNAARRLVADSVVSLGEFPFESKRVPVEITKTGVKIGGQKEMTFEKLVQDTTRERRSELDRLRNERLKSSDAELGGRIQLVEQQVRDLEALGTEIRSPESVAKLIEAIKKHATPEEVARLKAEGKKPGEGVKGAVNRLGAYALVASFVAASLAGSSRPEDVPNYAPTSY